MPRTFQPDWTTILHQHLEKIEKAQSEQFCGAINLHPCMSRFRLDLMRFGIAQKQTIRTGKISHFGDRKRKAPPLASHYRNRYRNCIRICDENDEAHSKPLITSRDLVGHYKSPLPRSFLSFPQKTPQKTPRRRPDEAVEGRAALESRLLLSHLVSLLLPMRQ